VAENDDLLDPSEIEALLNSNLTPGPAKPSSAKAPPPGGNPPAPGGDTMSQQDLDALFRQAPSAQAPPAAASGREMLGTADIEALLKQRDIGRPRGPTERTAEALLDQVEADLAAAIAPELKSSRSLGPEFRGAKPFELQSFENSALNADAAALDTLQEVELDLRIELGRAELLIEEVLKLREGSVVPLDKLAGDPVDILVNGRLIARGEVLVLNDNFCVRVAEILSPTF
jgi:flagellar motor switch protein FliN/FliY